jgi:hypothetical protein
MTVCSDQQVQRFGTTPEQLQKGLKEEGRAQRESKEKKRTWNEKTLKQVRFGCREHSVACQ